MLCDICGEPLAQDVLPQAPSPDALQACAREIKEDSNHIDYEFSLRTGKSNF